MNDEKYDLDQAVTSPVEAPMIEVNGHKLTVDDAMEAVRLGERKARRAVAKGDLDKGVIVPAGALVALCAVVVMAGTDRRAAIGERAELATFAEDFRTRGLQAARELQHVQALVAEWAGPDGWKAMNALTLEDQGYSRAWRYCTEQLADVLNLTPPDPEGGELQ